MPRSYSFDHFTAKNPLATRALKGREKQKVTRSGPELKDEKFHYGRAHAETEEILTVKAMNAQLEELAGLKEEEIRSAPAAEQPKQAAAQREPPPVQHKGPTAPIGAMPAMQEEPPQSGLLTELADHAGRHVRGVSLAARDLGRAGLKLVTFPLHAARLAARRLRALKS